MRSASASTYAGRSGLPLSSLPSMRITQRACGIFCSGERFQREQRAEYGVTVISAAATIQTTVANHRRPRREPFGPAGELRLLVHVAVHEHAVLAVLVAGRRHVDEQQRRAPGQAHDFGFHAGQGIGLAPLTHQLRGRIHVTVFFPLLVEVCRLVGNTDVLAQRRHDGFVPDLADEAQQLLFVHSSLNPVSARCRPSANRTGVTHCWW